MSVSDSIHDRFHGLLQGYSDDAARKQQAAQRAEAVRIAREDKREGIAKVIRADAAKTAALLVAQGKQSSEKVMGKPLGGLTKIFDVPFWIIGYSPKVDKTKPFFDAEIWDHTTATKIGVGLNAAGDLIVFTDANTDHPLELVDPMGWGNAPDELIVPTARINENVAAPEDQQIVDYWRRQFTSNLAQRILYSSDPTAPDGVQRLEKIPHLRSWRPEE